MKIVNKPWGKEVWLELNDRYCFKRIHLNEGQRTSYQYHNKKIETSYIIEGEVEVWLENDKGEIEKTRMFPGDHYTALPLRKHRVIAVKNAVYLEASSPEVDDIIRINDEFGRPDGRIESEHSSSETLVKSSDK